MARSRKQSRVGCVRTVMQSSTTFKPDVQKACKIAKKLEKLAADNPGSCAETAMLDNIAQEFFNATFDVLALDIVRNPHLGFTGDFIKRLQAMIKWKLDATACPVRRWFAIKQPGTTTTGTTTTATTAATATATSTTTTATATTTTTTTAAAAMATSTTTTGTTTTTTAAAAMATSTTATATATAENSARLRAAQAMLGLQCDSGMDMETDALATDSETDSGTESGVDTDTDTVGDFKVRATLPAQSCVMYDSLESLDTFLNKVIRVVGDDAADGWLSLTTNDATVQFSATQLLAEPEAVVQIHRNLGTLQQDDIHVEYVHRG